MQTTKGNLLLSGNCLEVLKTLKDNSVDAVVTDPPYGLGDEPDIVEVMRDWVDHGYHEVKSKKGFMGKTWDAFVPQPVVWREVFRVLKPGGHILVACGTRTQDWMTASLRFAGFEIRDIVIYCYGSGFPKSLNISKQFINNIRNDIDKSNLIYIFDVWREYLKTAKNVGVLLQKRKTATGTNTIKNDSVHENVLPISSPLNLWSNAIIAELNSADPPHTSEEAGHIVQEIAEALQILSKSLATVAVNLPENQNATPFLITGTAPKYVLEWLKENTTDKIRAAEALKTWLGKKKFSESADTNALCADLTEILKHIMLSLSAKYRNADTTQQMVFASAITVTITEYMAASLIEYTAAILGKNNAAAAWDGWGTALKPAMELWTLARKPLSENTVAANVLKWGTGGLNIDGCRVETDEALNYGTGKKSNVGFKTSPQNDDRPEYDGKGRFPANLIHDGSDEVVGLFPDTKSGKMKQTVEGGQFTVYGKQNAREVETIGDSGSAARFFYCAKASKSERGEGNVHPTVKPLALMRYLCRLITPEWGTILDPFAGSGTTGAAAIAEDFGVILIEREAEYLPIIEKRLNDAENAA